MPNTYTQIHIQFIFAVKYRMALIDPEWKESLHQYVTGIFQQNNHKMLQINSVPDHIHILVGFRPNQSISQVIQNVKTESSKWIIQNQLCKRKFAWQTGFGAFSYSKSHIPNVIRYIKNQDKHHKSNSFLDEYKLLLKKFEVDYDDRYIFRHPE
ncbi:MAG: IS200/IS605 family transposase [Balneolaceae bacterium]|nr:IS200/IS605 family transposase [Balneolaceae bacterium]